MKNYKVNEIFYSLQGEGANTGTPAIFIRFSGCNLCCPFCDTDFAAFTEMTADEIAAAAAAYPAELVVLTGGEPSLQVDDTLVHLLHEKGKYIAIETNGTHSLPDGIDWITLSPKENSRLALTSAHEVKVVYTGQDVEQYFTLFPDALWHYLQPCSITRDGITTDNRDEVIRYCLAHPHWALSLQTHKLINIR